MGPYVGYRIKCRGKWKVLQSLWDKGNHNVNISYHSEFITSKLLAISIIKLRRCKPEEFKDFML